MNALERMKMKVNIKQKIFLAGIKDEALEKDETSEENESFRG